MTNKIPEYKKLLHELHITSTTRIFEDFSEDKISKDTAAMKEVFPGNYHLIEQYDPTFGKFIYKIEFDNVEDRTFFILQHGE